MTLTLPAETEVRLQTLAALRNQPPEAVIDAALEALLRKELAREHQASLHRLLLAATAEAKLIEPEPYDSPVRTYYRESEYGKIVAEKFRKQGFNV